MDKVTHCKDSPRETRMSSSVKQQQHGTTLSSLVHSKTLQQHTAVKDAHMRRRDFYEYRLIASTRLDLIINFVLYIS